MYIESEKFSLWADFIERDYLEGEFKELIEKKIINGATSNPAIFKNAILTSHAYKDQLSSLSHLTPKKQYEAVAIFDIQKAADILLPLYNSRDDGYVSIEVDPFLCDDAEATIEEGVRLYNSINRKNVMIKIPATDAGYIAMEALVSQSIAVNATLIFSKEQALSCAKAFKNGAKKAKKNVDTVISVFVSRIDRAIDAQLKTLNIDTALAGIYNASAIYEAIEALNIQGCRTLFASTGVKGDAQVPSYYVDELLASHSVNTAPIDTINAFVENGKNSIKLPIPKNKVDSLFDAISTAGIDIDEVIEKQISDGLSQFKDAFSEILEALEK
jgi:transaldolase